MNEEINKIKADIFDIIRNQEELMAAFNALNTTKTEKLKQLGELERKSQLSPVETRG